MQVVKLVAVGALLTLLSFMVVSAISDKSFLHQRAERQQQELEEARARIAVLERQLAGERTDSSAAFYSSRASPGLFKRRGEHRHLATQLEVLRKHDEAPLEQRLDAPPPEVSRLEAAAAQIRSGACREAWLARVRAEGGRRAHGVPLPFAGGDLEEPGVLEAMLAARAPDKELIFLSVGDTKDHRRATKDPALRTISTDFLLNLLANLKRLQIDHYVILTTRKLCARLQQEQCEYSCVWTELWHSHPGLPLWDLRPGDMFLMWAQQWRYIAAAMERGYRIMRTDTDVYFAEDPYPILRGPLFSPFQMVVQHDFFGAKERPRCDSPPRQIDGGLPSCGIRSAHLALLNIGLVYLRSTAGGGVHAVINGTWARFVERLGSAPSRPAHLRGAVDTQQLIDQPFMREVANSLAIADDAVVPRKPPSMWATIPGSAAEVYGGGATCALREEGLCARVREERRKTAFLAQLVRPRRPRDGRAVAERIALAPDWLFGRGCLTHMRRPAEFLRLVSPGSEASTTCLSQPTRLGEAPLAPGPAAGLLVATHFVYSMALKRKRAFRAFGWDLADQRNRTVSSGACFHRSDRGMLFGHTFFDQLKQTKSILCSLPPNDEPACSCCAGIGSAVKHDGRYGRGAEYRFESTGGSFTGGPSMMRNLEGCNDYQMFWD
ncbi:hypothetical protein AB1Y20_009121 [Prymnesium parvum]|uniref:Nucleotide-diphospho-sugar transferase domain-containing protein n=1 Tax=Prymnesium parvum TaxID=97485 RepID=A0AB34K0G7_PRYPA